MSAAPASGSSSCFVARYAPTSKCTLVLRRTRRKTSAAVVRPVLMISSCGGECTWPLVCRASTRASASRKTRPAALAVRRSALASKGFIETTLVFWPQRMRRHARRSYRRVVSWRQPASCDTIRFDSLDSGAEDLRTSKSIDSHKWLD